MLPSLYVNRGLPDDILQLDLSEGILLVEGVLVREILGFQYDDHECPEIVGHVVGEDVCCRWWIAMVVVVDVMAAPDK